MMNLQELERLLIEAHRALEDGALISSRNAIVTAKLMVQQEMATGPDVMRGTGRTSLQMRFAPKNAMFVWGFDDSMFYPRALSRHLGRPDLVIVTPRMIESLWAPGTECVVDHAAVLTVRQRDFLETRKMR